MTLCSLLGYYWDEEVRSGNKGILIKKNLIATDMGLISSLACWIYLEKWLQMWPRDGWNTKNWIGYYLRTEKRTKQGKEQTASGFIAIVLCTFAAPFERVLLSTEITSRYLCCGSLLSSLHLWLLFFAGQCFCV